MINIDETKHRLLLTEWQLNAGIVGMLNILGKKDNELPKINEFNFQSGYLDDFAEKYFSYFIETYKKTLSWYKIVQFKEKIARFEESDFAYLDEKQYEQINLYIRDVAKKYINSASYKAAYPLIKANLDIREKGSNLKQLPKLTKKLSFDKNREEIIVLVKEKFEEIKEIIAYFDTPEAKKYIGAKNVLYTLIRKGWDGVSALNPQTKEKDPYLDFHQYFVQPCLDYLEADKTKYKFSCCTCEQPIKNLDETFSFLVETGYDTKRKGSHGWNFVNDMGLCPICKLIYACIPAGFTYVINQGIFINASQNLSELVRVNQKVKMDILKRNSSEQGVREVNTYVGMIEAILEQENKSHTYELSDIQVVRYEEDRYYFTLLSKRVLKILNQSKVFLEPLIKANFPEGNLYQSAVQKIMNSENLFSLIHKLLIYKVTNVKNLYYGIYHVDYLLNINQKFLGGIQKMNELSQEELKKVRASGWYLGKEYDNKNKVKSIAQRLLNTLKSNNRDGFMDIILNCYAYVGKTVPNWGIQIFQDDETFKTIGYSFVSGLIGDKDKDKENGDGK
ncbi:type I-B CRISPR-associated protein Cas8b1/Cst1 [Vagococcus entomophilus]|uniref:Type I-B CRISPR-associated protein Cas8b1/Cst1 n=1 Tax=Vagococcus entomophilus TaxID=1160095 RepID=A0A430AKK7_9ENTE|nr:type I-B CRISPR-associated protein Cas8b1/Cst1 [Vagococcus entomophilus]RSU08641.1 type I-B CRISPR-associated protein Cas8b1/Cst1 [Vagococcus entomophilus]